MAKKLAQMGVFVALAMIFSYVEVLIPFHFGIPGVKLGIANLVVVVGFYMFHEKEVFGISVIRIILVGILFGDGVSLVYSLAGGLLSFLAMLLGKKVSGFSIVGISILGGVFHNVGQLCAAIVILQNKGIITYLPVLLVAGIVTGTLIGILSKQIVKSLTLDSK